VQFIGRPEAIEAELARHPDAPRARIEVVQASETITMADKPLQAVRQKRDSSIVVGLKRHADGASEAFVSAGNTGAVLAASTLHLGLHDGVRRATVATIFPTSAAPVLVLDGGANVDCSPEELVGFARLGTVYMRDLHGRHAPKVGLLNLGEEDEKGNAVSRAAHQLLRSLPGINFIGNIEGRDIISGHSKLGHLDVVVCDGFVGNIVLKFYESVGKFIVDLLEAHAPHVLADPGVKEVFRVLDYSEYGGAPLLGVKGVSIICHGSSTPLAIKNGFRLAVQSVQAGLSRHIGQEFAATEAATS
jgi:glycerol-3-phosphate acyltransferase PlsX